MRAVFGVVSLLMVLAVVGVLVGRQMKGAGRVPLAAEATAPVPASAGTLREQSQQVQDKVRSDVAKALEQGAGRREEADK